MAAVTSMRSVFVNICIVLSSVRAYISSGPSLDDDMLLPFPSFEEWPRHSHRHVRDCQPDIFGNATHETFPAHRNSNITVPSTTRYFVTKVVDSLGKVKNGYGHYTVINNPLRTFSVVEPGGSNGCIEERRRTVLNTSQARTCHVAVNAGFFNTHTGACLGNVVTDGKRIQDSGGIQNANFGIRKDGTIVVGYLSELDILQEDNPFVQLVTGVIWLVRNGTVYVNESQTTECADMQETGSLDRFVNVVSARSAVGHDEEGRVVLVHIDGQTGDRGVSLWEFSDYLQRLGLVNAINLDGGGSATVVMDGTVANYPSDHCADNPAWRCARAVSTALCVHSLDCEPANCSGHGKCVNGECQCQGRWSGSGCEELDCGDCGVHGTCTEGGCVCEEGWLGAACDEPDCHPSNCSGHGICVMGQCQCQENSNSSWSGPACDVLQCGPNNCSSHGSCMVDGCVCDPGWVGVECELTCPPGVFGPSCAVACTCEHGATCDPQTGACTCQPGWTGVACDHVCPYGTFGTECSHRCECADSCSCDRVTGDCNVTLNQTLPTDLYSASHCIATGVIKEEVSKIRQEMEDLLRNPWFIACVSCASLLFISLIGNVILLCYHCSCSCTSRPIKYSHLPMHDLPFDRFQDELEVDNKSQSHNQSTKL
ncbi:N-acetylglucosamine-1-phosphodiester alpha-N-acetylglucosaminidase-like [Branchiostoma floridae x Branchiostoma belcheri]